MLVLLIEKLLMVTLICLLQGTLISHFTRYGFQKFDQLLVQFAHLADLFKCVDQFFVQK